MANNVKFKWFDIAGSTATTNINRINGVNDEDLLYVKSTTPGTGSSVVSLPYLLRTRGVNWYGAATPPFVAYTDGTNSFTTRPLVDIGGATLSILKDPTGDTGNYWSVTAFQDNTGEGFKIKINTDAIKGDVAPSYNALGFYTSATAAGSSSPKLITSYTPASALNVDFEKYLTGQMSGGRLSLNVNAVTSVTSSSSNNNIPTSKAVWDAIVAYVGTAVHFIGTSTTDPKGASGATVAGHTIWSKGDVVIYGYKEYILTGTSNTAANWTELGDEGLWLSSFEVKTAGSIKVNSGTTYTVNKTNNSFTIQHDQTGVAEQSSLALLKLTFNNEGHITGKDSVSASDITPLVTFGTLNTNNSTAQTVSSSEPFGGTINLHKVSKTGSYNDLLNKPTIPSAANNGILNVKAGSSTAGQIFTANQSGNSTLTISGSNGVNISAASGGSNTARTVTVKGPDLQINGTSVTTPATSNASVVVNAEAKDSNNVTGNGVIKYTYNLGDGGSGSASYYLEVMTWEELS